MSRKWQGRYRIGMWSWNVGAVVIARVLKRDRGLLARHFPPSVSHAKPPALFIRVHFLNTHDVIDFRFLLRMSSQ
jgi:hypothetical protein